MTLDEAIGHAREVARTCDDSRCAKDHERLAEWLEELRLARESRLSEIPQMARTIHENHELSEENAKLRELVRMMWEPFCWAQSGYDVCLTDEQDKAIRDLVRELGVEVDE